MANLSTFSMLRTRTQKYKKDYSLDTLESAFIWLGLETLLNLNEDEIEETITDGSDDGGIDAVYIKENNVYIFTYKYTNKFENSKKNFPQNDLDKIIVTMESIYDKSTKASEVNPVLWDKIKEIWDLYKRKQLNFKYYICTNKAKPTSGARNRFEKSLKKFRFVEFFYIDQEEFVSNIIEKKFNKIDGKLQFIEKQYFDRSDGNLKGTVATISASDLINLIKNPENPTEVIEDVFNENVRIYLKLKNRINKNIYDTALSNENYEFWYLNNGITIVCEECSYTPNIRSPIVELKNLQIVNGGQTTHAIFEAYLNNSEKVENVLVLARIYETKKNYKISEKISETTNSQTPIRSRDLRANDQLQKQLEDEFKSMGYYYERKKNQYADQKKSKRLDNELLGQIYMAYYLEMPSEAKNNKMLIFGEKYDDIFNEETTAKKLLVPYKIFLPLEIIKKDIQRRKRRKVKIKTKEDFISRAIFHLLNISKIIIETEKVDISKEITLKRTINKAINFLYEIVKIERKKRGMDYSHDKFFKKINTNSVVRSYMQNHYKL